MLQNLYTNLSQKDNALLKEQPFKSYGLKIVYFQLTRFCDVLSEQLLID